MSSGNNTEWFKTIPLEAWTNSQWKQSSKRARHRTGSCSTTGWVSPSDVIDTPCDVNICHWNSEQLNKMSIGDKLNLLINNMSELKVMNTVCRNNLVNTSHLEVVDQSLQVLEYKSLDMEASSKDRNLIFGGIVETVGGVPFDAVLDVLSSKLGMPSESFYMVEARRIGRIIRPNSGQMFVRQRDILVTFSTPDQVTKILQRANRLAGTRISIYRDYPREIKDTRSQLWPEFKRMPDIHGRHHVKLLFPAALSVKGEIVRDLFPQCTETWHTLTAQTFMDADSVSSMRSVGNRKLRSTLRLWHPKTQQVLSQHRRPLH